MSARLTLLLLCDPSELPSLFLAALAAADFQLLFAQHVEHATSILSSLIVDAILIGLGSALGAAELKRAAPRTPTILLSSESRALDAQGGIDSVCRADLKDEVVARAVAVFFRQSLLLGRPQKNALLPREKRDRIASGARQQVAI